MKLPKAATHELRLAGTEAVLDRFFAEIAHLGAKLGPVLIQTPGKLDFEAEIAEAFFLALRQRFGGEVVMEPRGPSWFESDATVLLARHRIARVGADPARAPAAASPVGQPRYWRLHGSPRIYWSNYSSEYLNKLNEQLSPMDWCVFDNTASGAAAADALGLLERLESTA